MSGTELANIAGTPAGLLALVVVLGIFIALLLKWIASLLKQVQAGVEQRLDDNTKAIEQIRKEQNEAIQQTRKDHAAAIDSVWHHLSRHEGDLPKTYVLRDDFIRTLTAFDKKQDQMLDLLMALQCKKGGICGPAEASGS